MAVLQVCAGCLIEDGVCSMLEERGAMERRERGSRGCAGELSRAEVVTVRDRLLGGIRGYEVRSLAFGGSG